MGRIQDLALTLEPHEFGFFFSGFMSNWGKANEQ